MELELKINNRSEIVKEVKREGNVLTLSVGEKLYKVDIVKVSNEEFSILLNGKSFNIEVIEASKPKHYNVNALYFKFEVEVIDNESRYRQNRMQSGPISNDNTIRSPMPGKVVKVYVKPGDRVEPGQPLIVLSAMKMESEFKAGNRGIVREVPVIEGETVDTNQLLVIIDEDETLEVD
ncbi:MAG: acetyl-CoA carboxylase biotin carboxyl carrier protein subunit [Mariniphaga sp.]|nr:acetyl-CoA carboxylase biotin carboxyl carrier protein subunit [Mariniphaga sp.]